MHKNEIDLQSLTEEQTLELEIAAGALGKQYQDALVIQKKRQERENRFIASVVEDDNAV